MFLLVTPNFSILEGDRDFGQESSAHHGSIGCSFCTEKKKCSDRGFVDKEHRFISASGCEISRTRS
jgi:hypothetical protein